MKESYREDLASCSGPESYAGRGNTADVATAGEHAGQLLSSDITSSVCRPCGGFGKATRQASLLARCETARRSRRTCACVENFQRENREILGVSEPCGSERSKNASGDKVDMNASRKSDRSVVPAKSANNLADHAEAESMEGRGLANRNVEESNPHRTQSRGRGSRGLLGIREAAARDGKLKFNALFHHLTLDQLRVSFFDLKKSAAAGVDEVTWRDYEPGLEDRLIDLHDRIHRGAYRAQPTKRTWIPKADGRMRPLGITAFEDKIVQQAAQVILQQIYEVDFLGFSYGFRPGRGCHQALDALAYAVPTCACTMCSICGSTGGGRTAPEVTW